MALSAAINFSEQAHRTLPESWTEGREHRDSAPYHQALAGRHLSNAYDAIRTMAETLAYRA